MIFESEIVSENNPPTQIQGSASYNVGYVSVQQSAHVGKVARLWKIVKEDGVEKSREEFNNSNYRASPKIIVVGTNTASEEARAYIQNAIATQNEGAIYAAAQTAATIAARPVQEEPDAENPDEENPDQKPEDGDSKKEDPKKDNSKKDPSKTDKDDPKKEDSKKPEKDNSKKDEEEPKENTEEDSKASVNNKEIQETEQASVNSKKTAENQE